MLILDQADETYVNNGTLDEDIIVRAPGVTVTNTAQGRINGQFIFEVGGSTLINQVGGFIGFTDPIDAVTLIAIQGSDGDDTLINSGTIAGEVDFGDGNDLFHLEDGFSSSIGTIIGGAGIDTFELGESTTFFDASTVTQFENLSLQASGTFTNFDGFSQITGPTNSDDAIVLRDSDNPLATVELSGSNWVLANSILSSVVGTDRDDFLTLSGAITSVPNGIDLGGGDDTVLLTDSVINSLNDPRFPGRLPSIEGGTGDRDQVQIGSSTSAQWDLGNFTGFEELVVANGTVDTLTIDFLQLFNVDNFDRIDISNGLRSSDLTVRLLRSGSPDADVTIDPGTTIEIGFSTRINNLYHFDFANGSQPEEDAADPSNSITVLNDGRIIGAVFFSNGNDTYDGSRGRNGTVFAGAGDDTLIGSIESDELYGQAGDDILNGGLDSDTLEGGLGDDTAVFGGNRSQYTITQTSPEGFLVSGPDGDDTLTGIEVAQFDDERVQFNVVTTFEQPGQSFNNLAVINENIIVRASGVTFTNTDRGRVNGQFIFEVGGSTLINERDGIISGFDSNNPDRPTVIGSAGDDTVINFFIIGGPISLGDGNDTLVTRGGTHRGIDLGDGDDTFRLEGPLDVTGAVANGGDGIDTFEYADTRTFNGLSVFGDDLVGFEILRLEGAGNFHDFNGFSEIIADNAADFPITFFDSHNPNATIELNGGIWTFNGSTFQALVGSDAAESVSLYQGSTIAQDILLGGGDDRLFFSTSAVDAVASRIDGGEGDDDTVVLTQLQDGAILTLFALENFEELQISNVFGVDEMTVTLDGYRDFQRIGVGRGIDFVLASGSFSGPSIKGAEGGSVTIENGRTIANFGFFSVDNPPGFDRTISNAELSQILTNRGTITGDVYFSIGNDLYDGRGASLIGLVHGNSGDDTMLGGNGRETFFGDAGDDLLDGGRGNDTLDGGTGEDTAVFAGNSTQYTITQTSREGFVIEGPDGTDTLTDVEFAQFDDETIRIIPDSPTTFGQPGEDVVNEEIIFNDVALGAQGVSFTNTADGLIDGFFTFAVGGSTLINQAGGVIGAGDLTGGAFYQAVYGSDGDDTLINEGSIFGFVDLGDGNDRYSSIFLLSPSQSGSQTQSTLGAGDDVYRIEGFGRSLNVDGGTGYDIFEFALEGNSGSLSGIAVDGFEELRVSSRNWSLRNIEGLEVIVLEPLDESYSFFLSDSENPNARVELNGNRLNLLESTVGSVLGSDASDTVDFTGASRVNGAVTLGGGQDFVYLSDGLETLEISTPSEVAVSIDGGEGEDFILIFGTIEEYDASFASFTGFEELRIGTTLVEQTVNFDLSDLNDFEIINIDDNADLSLASVNSPDARLIGSRGSTITLAADVIIDEYIHSTGAFVQGTDGLVADASHSTVLNNGGTIVDRIIFGTGNDLYDGSAGSVGRVFGNAGNDTILGGSSAESFFGNAGADTLNGGGGNDLLDGGRNVDTAIFSGSRADYSVTQTEMGVFEVVGADGTDTLTTIEFAQFDNETVRLLRGTGVSVTFETSDPSVYAEAATGLRDFDGNDLGGDGAWLRIGSADVNGDGDVDQILVNDAIGRFATVGTADDGLVYFDDHSWAGETRVAGIYIDPFVADGSVEQGSEFDSQRRFQNDLEIENINRVLGANDYNDDGVWEVYLALTDGTAYLQALMHADGNIRFANYQSEDQVREYLTENGFGEETFGDWFPDSQSSGQSSGQVVQETRGETVALASLDAMPHAASMWQGPNSELGADFFG